MPSAVTLQDGTRLMFAYGRMYNGTSLASFLFASDDEYGNSWKFRKSFEHTYGMPSAAGCMVNPRHSTPGPCGPCEPAMTLLPDGKTLLAVFRMQSNRNLWQSTSLDGGYTWTPLVETLSWAVFPQLRTLRNG